MKIPFAISPKYKVFESEHLAIAGEEHIVKNLARSLIYDDEPCNPVGDTIFSIEVSLNLNGVRDDVKEDEEGDFDFADDTVLPATIGHGMIIYATVGMLKALVNAVRNSEHTDEFADELAEFVRATLTPYLISVAGAPHCAAVIYAADKDDAIREAEELYGDENEITAKEISHEDAIKLEDDGTEVHIVSEDNWW